MDKYLKMTIWIVYFLSAVCLQFNFTHLMMEGQGVVEEERIHLVAEEELAEMIFKMNKIKNGT